MELSLRPPEYAQRANVQRAAVRPVRHRKLDTRPGMPGQTLYRRHSQEIGKPISLWHICVYHGNIFQTFEEMDIYCFGRLIYEMTFGEPLTSTFIVNDDTIHWPTPAISNSIIVTLLSVSYICELAMLLLSYETIDQD